MKSPKWYVTAVNHFGRCLGRVALVKDLELNNWRTFETWLSGQGWTAGGQNNIRHRLRIIWSHAYEAGHAPVLPPKQSRAMPKRRIPGSQRRF